MAYLEPQELVDYVGSEIVDDHPFLVRCLAAASEAVNDYCGRSFETPVVPPTVVTRYYYPVADTVVIHDLVDATGLVVVDDGTTVDAADYQLEPVNNVSTSGLVRPYHRIRRLGVCWSSPSRSGEVSIEVTSNRWGWPAVPAVVKEATAVLAKDIVHLRTTRFGVAGFGEFGVVRVRDNPHVKMLLANVRHPSKLVVA